jgi:hypothetical protein
VNLGKFSPPAVTARDAVVLEGEERFTGVLNPPIISRPASFGSQAMKSSALYVLVTVAAFFVMCASVLAVGPQGKNPRSAKGQSDFSDPVSKPSIIQSACLKCHGGGSVNGDLDFTQSLTREQKVDAMTKAARGEMPKNGPKLTPPQLSQLQKELGLVKNTGASSASNGAAAASPLAKSPAPKTRSSKAPASVTSQASTSVTAPQAHISIVRPSDNIPTGRVQVVPADVSRSLSAARTANPRPRLKKVLPPAAFTVSDPKPQTDTTKPLENLTAEKEDTSKIAEEIKDLVGTWMAVSRQGDGELSTVELQLDDHGWAKLTIPGADGKPATTTRKVEVEKKELKLTGSGANADMVLGKLVDFNSHQMVLERSDGLVTFVRPPAAN